MFLLIGLLILSAVVLLSLTLFSIALEKAQLWQAKKETKVTQELDRMFSDKSPAQIVRLYFILPPILGLLGILLFRSFLFALLGAIVGLFIPGFILKIRESKRRQKFNRQILDAIMILSSSLKGGLSLLQALEVLQEEMPVPMNQEVGLVVRENKMGITLEESLMRLNKRMYSEDLELLTNSILVARETGGDLTKVLSRLVTTIRDNRKLKDTIRTLTLQGRLQGIIMSALPFLFAWWVLTFNRSHFDVLLNTQQGRVLLFVAIFLQIIGMFLIRKFSTIRM